MPLADVLCMHAGHSRMYGPAHHHLPALPSCATLPTVRASHRAAHVAIHAVPVAALAAARAVQHRRPSPHATLCAQAAVGCALIFVRRAASDWMQHLAWLSIQQLVALPAGSTSHAVAAAQPSCVCATCRCLAAPAGNWVARLCRRCMLLPEAKPSLLAAPAGAAGDPISVSTLGGSVTAGQGALHGASSCTAAAARSCWERAAAGAGVLRRGMLVAQYRHGAGPCAIAVGASVACQSACATCQLPDAGGPYVARWFNWLREISPSPTASVDHALKNPAFGGSTSGAWGQGCRGVPQPLCWTVLCLW